MDFLNSLDELPARVRLAVPDLPMPQIELQEEGTERVRVVVRPRSGTEGLFGHVFSGLLRAMADDYGALVFLDLNPGEDGIDIIDVCLLDVDFAEARDFELGAQAG